MYVLVVGKKRLRVVARVTVATRVTARVRVRASEVRLTQMLGWKCWND